MFLHTETCQRVLIAVAGTLTLCPTVCFADLPWVQVSEVSDPAHGSIPEGMDIRIARIEQIGDLLRFSIEASGDIQLSYPSETTFGVFMWHIDADNDPNTGFGRPAGEVGADFTIRIDLNGEFSTGRVDKTGSLPSGSTNRWPGTGHLWIDQNVISISVPLVQISSPQQFNWSAETAERSDAGFDVQNPYTASTNALILADPPPKPTVELIPPYFMLSPAGPNTGQLQVVIRDENGIELDSSGIDLLFSIDSTAEFAEVDKVTGLVTAHSPRKNSDPNHMFECWPTEYRVPMHRYCASPKPTSISVTPIIRGYECRIICLARCRVLTWMDLWYRTKSSKPRTMPIWPSNTLTALSRLTARVTTSWSISATIQRFPADWPAIHCGLVGN
jgi:hypothetical protein